LRFSWAFGGLGDKDGNHSKELNPAEAHCQPVPHLSSTVLGGGVAGPCDRTVSGDPSAHHAGHDGDASQPAAPLGEWLGEFELDETDTLRLFIKPFMDAHSWDEDRIDRCCTHVIRPDGKLDSFCRYCSGFADCGSGFWGWLRRSLLALPGWCT
jgi:hypothetical protein